MATMWHWLLQLLIFQKLGKSGFCTCHLQESITQWCMTMVMQTWYQLKAEELPLASTYDLGYEYVYLRNSWPLNFDYLFLGTPCISALWFVWRFCYIGNVLLFTNYNTYNVYQALNFRKMKNLFMVSAFSYEIYFILQVLVYTFKG